MEKTGADEMAAGVEDDEAGEGAAARTLVNVRSFLRLGVIALLTWARSSIGSPPS
jgi:hypothetical protein